VSFPDVSTFDQAKVLDALLAHLGIAQLYALVGASYGGMVGLAMAQAFPERIRHLCVISAAHKSAPMGVAWRTIQRQIVELGLSSNRGAEGLALARALAMSTYRTPEEFANRFDGERVDAAEPDSFPVWNYLRARGDDYTRHMDPRAFLCLSRSIDLHHVDPERVRVPLTLVGVRQDQLVPLSLTRELAAACGSHCELRELNSLYGHDAFLKETAFFSNLFQQL
jgi:homoserine O-acetyltransferase